MEGTDLYRKTRKKRAMEYDTVVSLACLEKSTLFLSTFCVEHCDSLDSWRYDFRPIKLLVSPTAFRQKFHGNGPSGVRTVFYLILQGSYVCVVFEFFRI